MSSSHQVDPVSGARLFGGEMLEWSDLERIGVGGAAGVLVRSLLGRTAGSSRVLLIGPRASRLLDELPAHHDIDILVRGLPDARRIGSAAQVRRGVTVHCGSLDRFEPRASYDLIVALDGPSMLLSPDSPGLTHQKTLQRMGKALSPHGNLVAVLENDLGLDRLLRLEVRDLYDSDAAWYRGAPGYDDRPLYLRELRGVLDSAGLVAGDVYAALPSVEQVSLLVRADGVQDPAIARTAAALAARVEGSYFSDHPAVADPYSLAVRVFDSGLALHLCSAWVVVAQPSSAASAPEGASGLPVLVASEESGRPQWRAVRIVSRVGDQWATTLTPVGGRPEMRERRVVRDYGALAETAAWGTTFEAALRAACAGGNVATIRALVQRYAAWLIAHAPTDGGSAGDARFFAVPANLILDDDGLTLLDPSWRLTQPLDDDVLLTHGLRHFVLRLLGSGAEHPWASDASPDGLTQTLAAMVGVDSTRLVDVVARLEAEVEVVVHGGDAAAEARAYGRNVERGSSRFAAPSGPSRGYREALALAGSLAQELHERTGQVEWLEATLRVRDRRVGNLEHQVTSVRESLSFRIGRVITWPGRAMIGGVRRAALSAIPPTYISRVMELLRRMTAR